VFTAQGIPKGKAILTRNDEQPKTRKKSYKLRKKRGKRKATGSNIMTLNLINVYASTAGVGHWQFTGRCKAVELIDWGFRRPIEHNVQQDGESIPIPNKMWTSFSTLQRKYLQNDVFECTNTFNENGVTCMAWRLKPWIRQRITDMNYTPQANGKLIDVVTRRPVTIASWSTVGRALPNVALWVPVHMKALAVGIDVMSKWIDYYRNGMKGQEPVVYKREMKNDKRRKDKRWCPEVKQAMIEYCERAKLEMTAFQDHALQHKHSMIMQTYKRADSGREYAQGLTLQSCTKLAAGTALHGCYQYDFESCHPTIAMQLSKRWEDCPRLKYLEQAVINKDGTRELLEHQSGQSLSAVKAALIMPMYGAKRTMWYKGAYIQTLTDKGYRRIQRSAFFNAYEQDVKEFYRHLLDNCRRNKEGRAINCNGRVAPVGSDMKSEAAHLMQGDESQCTTAAATVTSSAVVWKHDAIICTKQENIEAMVKAVKAATGFDLKIESERYEFSGLPTL
jgi:hypothetical protein